MAPTYKGAQLVESCRSNRCFIQELVGPGRLELPTSRLSGVRSNQLSYGPMAARRPIDQATAWDPERDRTHPWARDHIADLEAFLVERPIGDEWKEKRRRRNSAPVVFLDDGIDRRAEAFGSGQSSLERR